MCEAAGGDEQGAARGHTARIGLGMCQAARIPRQNAAWPAGAMKRRPRARSAGRAASELPADSPFVRGKVPSQHPRHDQGARRAGGAAWRAGRFKRPPKAAAHAGCRDSKWPACGGGRWGRDRACAGPNAGRTAVPKAGGPHPLGDIPKPCQPQGRREARALPSLRSMPRRADRRRHHRRGAARSCPAEARLAANGGNGPRAARGRPACVGPRNI